METTDSRYPYETVRAALYAQADETYRQFNERLLPPGTSTIGVRVPALRKLARAILKEDWRAYLAAALNRELTRCGSHMIRSDSSAAMFEAFVRLVSVTLARSGRNQLRSAAMPELRIGG